MHGDEAVWAAQDNKLHGCLDNVNKLLVSILESTLNKITWHGLKIFHETYRVILRFEKEHGQICGFTYIVFLDSNKANFIFFVKGI